VTVRGIVGAYAVASLLAVVAGFILEGIPLLPGGWPYSITWIALGPLALPFDAVRDWSLDLTAFVFYLIGSALVASCFLLTIHRRRIVRVVGYSLTGTVWLGWGVLTLALVWGA
jgi:hypothetical protein